MENSGVYAIRNLVNGNQYIGSSYNLRKRFQTHRWELSKGIHKNKHLQSAWNKYGSENFNFLVLENCMPSECISREQLWMLKCKPKYNKSIVAGGGSYPGINKGKKASLETRIKMSQSMKGRFVSKEAREKRGAALRGRKRGPVSPKELERLRAMHEARRGTKTPEHIKEKIRQSAKASPLVAEQIKRLAEINKKRVYKTGFSHSEETKNKMRLANKGQKRSEEVRETMRLAWVKRKKKKNK